MPHGLPRKANLFSFFIYAFLIGNASGSAPPINVTMNRYNVSRLAANTNEVVLNQSNVNPAQFGKLWSYPVDGVIFAQPLYVQNLTINGIIHNVLFIATMNDVVYAFDADANGAPLWTRDFRVGGATAAPSAWVPEMGSFVGIMSTPVIDTPSDSGSLFLVAQTLENGLWVYRIHKLNLDTGADVVPSAVISAVSNGKTFKPKQQNQRPGLILVNGQLVVCFSGRPYDDRPYHGWMMTYDAGTLIQNSVFVTSTSDDGAGIWGSGGAPPVDSAGNVYALTGNAFDGNVGYNGTTNFAESLLKMSVAPGGALALADWFTAYNWSDLDLQDEDLSCNAPMLIPNTDLIAFGSKTADVYVAHVGSLGHLQNGNPQLAAFFHVGQLLQPTFNDGDRMLGLAYWSGPNGPTLFAWPAFDSLHSYSYNGVTFTETSSNPIKGFGEPGMPISVSANNNQSGTGIVWTTMFSGSGRSVGQPGELHAFNAENLKQELWSSIMNSSRDSVGSPGKFVIPIVANGRVYQATSTNAVEVYGLLPVPPPVVRAVSIDFVGSGHPMAPSEIAGIIPKSNWNAASGAAHAAALSLVDETGAASPATLSWNSHTVWSTPIVDSPGNARMMKGYLDSDAVNPITVSVSGLPVSATGYDIYVYVDGDNNSATRTAAFSLTGKGITTAPINVTDPPNTNFSGALSQSTGSSGTYVKFSIQATAFTLTATPGTSSDPYPRAAVNGMQIVPGGTAAQTYSIAGSVMSSGVGLANVAINLNSSPTATTSSSGTYSLSNLPAGSYTLTPSAAGYTFSPPGQTFTNLSANQTANFTANVIPPRVVSIDFVGNGTPMSVSENAGVVAKTHWNNELHASSKAAAALFDETGVLNGASLTWSSNSVWSVPIIDSPGNVRMFRGYLDTSNNGTTTVNVSGLPASPTGFDIYAYIDGDNGSATRSATYSLSGTGITTASITATDTPGANYSGAFTKAVNSAGNYVQFTAVQATSFTLKATPGTASDGFPRAPLNGIQIVPH